MVSRRNFFIMTILMSVVFFLCMFMNNLKEEWNDYDVNPYITETAENYPSKVSMYVPDELKSSGTSGEEATKEAEEEDEAWTSRNRVIYIGGNVGIKAVTKEWAFYTKRDIAGFTSLTQYGSAGIDMESVEMLVIDSGSIDWKKQEELDFLSECIEKGTHLVFANLPDVSVIRSNKRVRELLGIRKVEKAETTVDGIHLYGGFLLGGEAVYQAVEKEDEKFQDMELTFPWYRLSSGTKVYMKGIPEDKKAEKEDYPVVIWRKSFPSAYVFAVNGGYMEDAAGLGILSAMSAEMYSYEIYPVVNAQSLVLANYPGTADENREALKELYGRSLRLLEQETIWPSIVTALQDYPAGLTCMMTPEYDYLDDKYPNPSELQYYMKIFHERFAETGLSLENVSDTSVLEKLSEDEKFMKETAGSYEFSSCYAGSMKDAQTERALEEELLSSVRTVVNAYDEDIVNLIGYLSEHVTRQNGSGDGLTYTFRNDFRMRCVETALGYLNLTCDMRRAAYPEDKKDIWDELSKNVIRNINVFGENYENFQGTTISESDEHIRNFLALDFTDIRKGDSIEITREGTEGTVWFVFRNYGREIKEIEGGSFKELEEGAYLVEAEEKEIKILLKPADERYYYQPSERR